MIATRSSILSGATIVLPPVFRAAIEDDADHWARVRIVAAAIPIDVDLDDQADVIRALFAARLCCADFVDVLDEAVESARERETS